MDGPGQQSREALAAEGVIWASHKGLSLVFLRIGAKLQRELKDQIWTVGRILSEADSKPGFTIQFSMMISSSVLFSQNRTWGGVEIDVFSCFFEFHFLFITLYSSLYLTPLGLGLEDKIFYLFHANVCPTLINNYIWFLDSHIWDAYHSS